MVAVPVFLNWHLRNVYYDMIYDDMKGSCVMKRIVHICIVIIVIVSVEQQLQQLATAVQHRSTAHQQADM